MTKEEREFILHLMADYQTDHAPLDDLKQTFWENAYDYYNELTDPDLQIAAEEMLND